MKYNIGLFNDSFPPTIDGVANTVYNYAEVLYKDDVNCTVVTPKYPGVFDDYPYDVVRFSSLVMPKRLEYRAGNIVPLKVLKILSDKKFDLIHVHSPFVSSLVADEVAKLNPGIPVVFTYHTKFDVELERRIKSKYFLKIARKFVLKNIKRADEVWVVSDGAAKSLRDIGYKGDYKVMKNGTDFKKGKSSEEEILKLKNELKISEDELMFLFVGRMMWYKNIKLILDALKLLPSKLKFKMVFVGDGLNRSEIEQYAKQIGIFEKCIFVGAVSDREKLREYYSASDLFIFPSTYDTSGLVVMEAAATKLPSVLIKNSCAAENVTDNQNGFLCNENTKSLKNTILQAVLDRKRLKEVGEHAQEEIYCSWEESVKNAYKRYEEIIENYEPKTFFGRKRRYKK